jgi:hypothetical protein
MFIPIPIAKLQQNAYEVNHKCKMQNKQWANSHLRGEFLRCSSTFLNFKKSAKSERPSSLGATGVGEDG